jgi:hypothetical protein
MANLDDMFRSAVPGGNIAKPLMIALLGLLASGALFKVAEERKVRPLSRSRLPRIREAAACSKG